MPEVGEVRYNVTADNSQVNNDIQNTEKQFKKSADKIESASETANKNVEKDFAGSSQKAQSYWGKAGSTIAKGIGAAFLTVGTVSVVAAGKSISSVTDLDKATNQFISSTGIAAQQTFRLSDGTEKLTDNTQKYRDIIKGIYGNNFGESFEDIANAMAEVQKQMSNLDDANLQNITESAFVLRDTFGYEVTESVRAANSLINQFGIDAKQAMNLIAQGAQNGLDYSGELLDTINEYSPQFQKLGMSAEDMFRIFQAGSDSGAFNLDKIGDAIKELSIRVVDGSDTTAAGFEAIGLNADEMTAKFAAGGQAAKEAFSETITGLSSMGDPLAQNQAGVALFGTMWEDLGPTAALALGQINEGIYETRDAMTELKDIKYDDLGSMFAGLGRTLETLLIPVGEQLIPLISEIISELLPPIQALLPPLIDSISAVLPIISELAAGILPVLVEMLTQITPFLTEIIDMVLPVFTQLLQTLLPPLMQIIEAIMPVLVSLLEALLPIISSLLELLSPILELFVALLQPILDIILMAITPLIEIIGELIAVAIEPLKDEIEVLQVIFSTVLGYLSEQAANSVQTIIDVFKNILDFFRNIFAGDWDAAWQNIVQIFSSIWDGIVNAAKSPINLVIGLINGFLTGLNNIRIPDWVPGIGGASVNIPLIPRLKKGLSFVPSDYFPAYLDYGERVLTREENIALMAAGGMPAIRQAAQSAIPSGVIPSGSAQKTVITVPLYLDGREIARATAWHMGEQLAWEER